MKTFLQLVAQDLYSKIGNDLSRTAIVFPNKRASLFFNEHLANQSDQPLWSPAYVSISELFQQLSVLKLEIRFVWYVNSTRYSMKKRKAKNHLTISTSGVSY